MTLIDIRAKDGSRQFLDLPQTVMWHRVRDHVAKLERAALIGFLCDNVTEAWIDFRYRDHCFTINDQLGEYWFFVQDPNCPEEILNIVADHFARLLSPSVSALLGLASTNKTRTH